MDGVSLALLIAHSMFLMMRQQANQGGIFQLSNEDLNIFHCHIDGLYEVNLDRRKLKTPGGKLFTVPNEALAIAVATEWDTQRDTLKFYTMHLVRPFTWQRRVSDFPYPLGPLLRT